MINHRISSTIPSFPFLNTAAAAADDDDNDDDDDDDDEDDDDVCNYEFYSKPFFPQWRSEWNYETDVGYSLS